MNEELIKRIDDTVDLIVSPTITKLLRDCKDALKHSEPVYRSHIWWGAGEPDCPRDIKGSNGELYALRCKLCGTNDSSEPCRQKPYHSEPKETSYEWCNYDNVRGFAWHISNPYSNRTVFGTEHEIKNYFPASEGFTHVRGIELLTTKE